MNVLTIGNMYPPHHLGGYELMWHSAVARMRERGHSVAVLTTDFRNPDPDPAIAAESDVHRELRWYWHEHRFPRLGLRARLSLERHNHAVLRRLIARRRPDVVSWWAMGGMSMSLLEAVRRAGLPALAVVVDDWLVYGPKVDAWQRAVGRLGPARRLVERASGIPARVDLDRAARWIFVSETTRRRARMGGRDPRQSEVVHGGIDVALFRPAREREWEWRLLYVGRIDRRKGIATAVGALRELPEATLEVVGGGDDEHRRELEALAADLGTADRLRFTSRSRDQISAAYAASDVVLFPVVWEEPFGLVPLEAMAVGRPVVATGAGGSGEYLRDGENALLFAPRDDPQALASAVRRLAADPGLRRRLRDGGFETASRLTESRFNDAVVDALEAVAR